MATLLHTKRLGRWGKGLLLAGLMLTARLSQAQVDTYTFAPSTGTYTQLPATATAVPDILTDDDISGVLPIGFTFVFDGTPYTSFYASSNGFLSFNSAADYANGNDLATGSSSLRPLVAPLWDDLGGGDPSSYAGYQLTGTAPNRVLTFEWRNWRWRYLATAPAISFQAKLYEGTNRVEFIYRPEAATPTSPTASIGLAGVGTGSGSFLSLSNSTATPTASSTVETSNIATPPAAGQVYAFTPPAPSLCPTPRNLSVTAITNTSATVSYTVSNTTPGPFTILYGPTGFNPALVPSSTNVYSIITSANSTAPLTGLTAQTGYQFYVVQNCGGTNGSSAISNAGSFTTNPNPPANNECTTAVGLTVAATCTTPLSGTVFGATQSVAPTTNCGGTTANDVWYSFTATSNSHTILLTPQFGAAYDVRSGACASTTSVFCGTVGSGASGNNTIGGLTAGQTYFLRVYATGTQPTTAAASTFTLCVVPGPTTPTNDDCAGAINVPIQFGTCVTQVSADNTAATASTGVAAPSCASYVSKDIWFKVTVPVSGAVTIQTLPPTGGSNVVDTGLNVYSGTCGTLTSIGCDDDSSPNGNYSLLDLTNRTPGEVLYIRVWAYNGNTTGPIAVCVTSPSNCAAPTSPSVGTTTNTTAVLNWVAPTGGTTGNTYEIEYGLQNFTQGSGTTVTGLTTTTQTVTGLTPATGYCFYVRQNCGTANGSSAWVGPTCFSTPLTAPTNDDPCGAIGLGAGTRTGTTLGALTSLQPGITTPVCSPASSPKDVWFSFVATGTTATFTVTGAPAGMVRVYSSPSCSAGPFALVSCTSSGSNNTAITAPVNVTGLTVGTRYYLAVSGYGSSDTGGTFTITPSAGVLAARTQTDTDALLVYPNPSSTGQLTLKLSGLSGVGQATLLNALGQVVRTKNLTAAAEQTLSTRNLAAGVYTLRVDTNDQTLTRKVVLE
ncbi:fibronectin type III domain-containing protein [Hymenobacter negativus]|uniref:Fibronectin type III domain-containing protein n=1 Tax=Hymenobacter negativus TaxID=2795026 RepID=A0ABS3QNZ0_9BACT|nr:fibronectin type III domain-containing protein [Hymenobacter negativus]MBO2012917.1 fibronectin type III domain-containing protein [Hymenobacter negativus]